MNKRSQKRAFCLHLAPLAGRGRIASAIRVRGSFNKRFSDRFENPAQILRYVAIPKPQHSIFMIGKPLVANCVAPAVRMLSTIHFHDQMEFTANKVDCIATDRHLSDEFVAVQPARSQAIPEHAFSICRHPSQASRLASLGLVSTAHADNPPHPPCFARRPLPASGARRRVAQIR